MSSASSNDGYFGEKTTLAARRFLAEDLGNFGSVVFFKANPNHPRRCQEFDGLSGVVVALLVFHVKERFLGGIARVGVVFLLMVVAVVVAALVLTLKGS